jgi:hypothetical protein
MGLSKSKTKTTNDPWAPAQPYILKNLQQQDDVFSSSQPALMQAAADQRATYGRVAPGAEQGIVGAQNLVNQNLSGANLGGNPYLDAILGKTRQDVINSVNDQFGTSGRFGSGMHQAILEQQLADAENAARFGNYNTERGYQQDAIGQAGNLMQGSQSLLNNAAELPWIGVQAANGAVRQASSGYGTQTQTSNPGIGQMLMGAAMGGLNAYAMNPKVFSDRRLKRAIELIGRLRDGLGVYRWVYAWGEKSSGVMADEVARLRPWALGPEVGGYATVNYGAL